MNRSEIFIFKPLSTGLGIERSHELRYAPGLWSGTRSLAVQAVRAAASAQAIRKAKASPVNPQNAVLHSPLMMSQRVVAILCDVMVCGSAALFALVCAGFFAACLDHVPASGPEIIGIVTSFSWLRQSMQIVIAVTNLAASMPWLPVAGFVTFFLSYRLVVSLVSGASPGENLVRWLSRV